MSIKNEIFNWVINLNSDQLEEQLPLINQKLKSHYKNNATLDNVMSSIVRTPIANKFGRDSKEHLLSKRLVALSKSDKKELINNGRQVLFDKLDSIKTYNQKEIFKVIYLCINSTDIYKKIIGLLLCSGCRPIEIIETSTFIKQGLLIKQDNPAKKRGQSFSITKPLIIITPEEFIKSVNYIRDKLKQIGYKTIMSKLNIKSKELLSESSYECRRIYGILSHSLYSNETSKEVWLNRVLGHSLNDINTQTHYSTVRIV